MSAIIGGIISYGITLQLMPVADKVQILYVSQDEIMEYENERVKQEKLEERQLFYGEVEKAVKLVANIPRFYQNRTTKVIYSTGFVSGEGVKSISREVYQQIMRELGADNNRKQLVNSTIYGTINESTKR